LVPYALIAFAAKAHLAGQSRADIDYGKVSDVPRRNSNTTVFKREFRTKIKLKGELCIEVIPPLT
jgi:hypothetical protein